MPEKAYNNEKIPDVQTVLVLPHAHVHVIHTHHKVQYIDDRYL